MTSDLRIPSLSDVESWFDLAATGATLSADDLRQWTSPCTRARAELDGALRALAVVPPGAAQARAYDQAQDALERLDRVASTAWERTGAAMAAVQPRVYALRDEAKAILARVTAGRQRAEALQANGYVGEPGELEACDRELRDAAAALREHDERDKALSRELNPLLQICGR